LLLLVAWHVPFTSARGALATAVGGAARLGRWVVRPGRVTVSLEPVFDNEFRLGRCTPARIDRGARFSVRELAAAPGFHRFFQEEDLGKYVKIVERQLLQIVGEFLTEHNVDLGDHDRNQASITDAAARNRRKVNRSGAIARDDRIVCSRSLPCTRGSAAP
jgi:hypothetical protein